MLLNDTHIVYYQNRQWDMMPSIPCESTQKMPRLLYYYQKRQLNMTLKAVRCQNANSTHSYFVWYHVSYIMLFTWIFCILRTLTDFWNFSHSCYKKYFANISGLLMFGIMVHLWPWSHEFSPFLKLFLVFLSHAQIKPNIAKQHSNVH